MTKGDDENYWHGGVANVLPNVVQSDIIVLQGVPYVHWAQLVRRYPP
jgi:hypothetical protein